jgi:hypothetical protein
MAFEVNKKIKLSLNWIFTFQFLWHVSSTRPKEQSAWLTKTRIPRVQKLSSRRSYTHPGKKNDMEQRNRNDFSNPSRNFGQRRSNKKHYAHKIDKLLLHLSTATSAASEKCANPACGKTTGAVQVLLVGGWDAPGGRGALAQRWRRCAPAGRDMMK